MKYKLLIAAAVISVTAIIVDTQHEAYGNANAAPSGTTGSPGDGGTTCATSGCHTGTAVTAQAGWITSNIPVAGYTPGTVYTITGTATYAGRTRFGFEISPQDASGNLVGTIAAGTGSQLVGGNKYITHTNAGTTGTSGSHTWSFTWTAPSSGTGALTFYGAFNCTNSGNNSSGDIVYTSTLAVNEAPTPGDDCGVFAIVTPSSFDCSGNIIPIVTVGNFGSNTLTSCTINYKIDANTPSTFTWNGNLASGAKANVTLPAITSTAGTHTFNATTSTPNGNSDVLITNDGKSTNYTTVLSGATLPFFEGFESTVFPPAGWIRKNPDNSTTWARSTAGHFAGVASAFMNLTAYSAVGQRDELITPPINLTLQQSPGLSFEVADAYYGASYVDTLTVLISTDCGSSWTQIYQKYGPSLQTVAATAAFTPTAAQWRLETIGLTSYATCSTAIFRFICGNGYGNNMYIDNVGVSGLTGITESGNLKPTMNLFPNPANDILTLEYTLVHTSAVSLKMFDIQGREVATMVSEKDKVAGKYSTRIDMNEYKTGVYFITFSDGASISTQKVMITR